MSILESIVLEAYELGLRDALFEQVSTIRKSDPRMKLEEVYERALTTVKTGASQKDTPIN